MMSAKEIVNKCAENKREEVSELSKIPHPAEFDKYFNL